jgi:hypothetical protein
MIEAMACGTPVLAFRCGSVPEIIDNGVTGQIVDTEEEAIRKLPHVLSLDRRAVRRRFEQRFSATRMAKDYIQLYRSLMQRPLLLADGAPEIRVVRPPIKSGSELIGLPGFPHQTFNFKRASSPRWPL